MNITQLWAAFRRRFGLHPLRRVGEPHYNCAADVIVDMRRCGYRRIGDAPVRAKLAKTDRCVKS
jgi:hypothetical protein